MATEILERLVPGRPGALLGLARLVPGLLVPGLLGLALLVPGRPGALLGLALGAAEAADKAVASRWR